MGHFNPGPFFQVLKHKGIISFRVVNCLLFSLTFELAFWCNQRFNCYSWMKNRTSHPLSEHPFCSDHCQTLFCLQRGKQRPIDKISAFESQYVQWEKELNLICEVITQSIQDESAMGRAVPSEMEALLLSSSTLKVDHHARDMSGRGEGRYATLWARGSL